MLKHLSQYMITHGWLFMTTMGSIFDFDFDWILCNTSYEATQRVVSAQVDELIRWLLLFLGGWLLPA